MRFKVYSLIKGFWSLWEHEPLPARYLPGQVPQTEAASADVAKLSGRPV